MPVKVNEQTYYRTGEALKEVGISRPTFYKWINENKVKDVSVRDRNHRRLFSEDDINRLKKYKEATISV